MENEPYRVGETEAGWVVEYRATRHGIPHYIAQYRTEELAREVAAFLNKHRIEEI